MTSKPWSGRFEKETDKLVDLLNYLSGEGISYFILGGGSNILISDKGFAGLVIKIEMKELDMHLEKLDGKKAKSIKTCQPQTAIVKVSYAKDKAAKKDKPRNLTIKSKKSAITLKKSKQKVKRRGERMAKGVGQEQARHFLRDVVPEKNFWINSGPIVRNLEGLLGVLENLEDDKFSYHVNKDKNDFAVWIREVVEDNTLAKTAANAKTKNAMSKVLKERIDKLKRAAV